MEFKGTQGKWILNNKEYYYEIKTDGKNNIRVSTYPSDDELLYDGHEKLISKDFIQEKKANALLISKAPEMLEMLKKCAFEFARYKAELGQGSDLEKECLSLIKEATAL